MKTILFKQGFKTLLVLLTGLLAMSSWGQTETETITITQISAGITQTGYDNGAERVWIQNSVSFGAKAVLKQQNQPHIQTQAGNGVIYNTTPLPGKIISIVLNQNGTARSSSLYGGNTTRLVNNIAGSYNVPEGTPQVGGASTTGWTPTQFEGTNYTYFAIKRGENAAYFTSIVITYELPTIPTHTVTFAPNGGSGTMTPQAASAAADLTLNTFTRLGYEFGGWNTAANGSGTAYTDGQEYDFSADLTLYAQWKPIITYDANGGINPPPAAVTALNGSHIIQSSGGMYRDNYDFINWNTQADGNGTTYTPGATATFTTPTTLYAQWLLCAATIQSISPASGAPVGTEITIIVTADYFNEGVSYDLLFNGSTTPVQGTATSDTTIKVTVPTDAKSGTLSISTEQGCPTLTTYTIITNDISGCE
jgi:uncharacterized repeat protein (TIGR02543 family)